MAELGLFPLPLVLVPTERVPLHIFEPRYRALVGECVETGDEFGIVLVRPDGDVHDIGTRAAVSQVLEVLPDGRMNIVVEGGDRFRLLEVERTDSFDIGTVEELTDAAGDAAPPADLDRALGLYAKLQETVGTANEPPDPRSPALDWELIARVEFPAERKQELLELTSPRRRLALLIELLERGLQALELQSELHRRAASNGKVTALPEES